MYCFARNTCYVCLGVKSNLINCMESDTPVYEKLHFISRYGRNNVAWLNTKRIILICEECCSRICVTYQFLKMWHKNSALLKGYMDLLNVTTDNILNTESDERELQIKLIDINEIKCDISHTDDDWGAETVIYEPEDWFVEDSLIIEEDTWKTEEVDEEEYSMDNSSIENRNNESNSEINSNAHITNTDCASSGITEETEDMSVEGEDSLNIEEDTREEVDNGEEYSVNNNSTESSNNESDSDISVNSNITNTDSDSSGVTSKQVPATNKRDSNNKPYKCTRCEQCYLYNSYLKQHMQTHSSRKSHKCSICEKCYKRKSSLARHMRNHTGEKPYECVICKQTFTIKYSLMLHMRLHTGETPYKCYICEKYLRTKWDLKRHMRTHTGDKP